MAVNPPPERKAECIEVIERAKLALKPGDRLDRAAICKQFPEISKATIWTWCRRIEVKMPARRELNAAANAIAERMTAGSVGDQLPALPSPRTLAGPNGERKLRQLDFAAEIPLLYSDAEMLRAFSVKNVDNAEAIKNPVQFEKSIRLRADLIADSLKLLQAVWDLRAVQQFNEVIIEEIGRESPDVQRRILKRLALLNQRHGINFHGLRA